MRPYGTLDSQKEFPNFLEEDKSADVLEFKPTKKQLLIQKLRNSKNNLLYIAAAATIAGIIGFNTLSPDTQDLIGSPNAFKVVQSLNLESSRKEKLFSLTKPQGFSSNQNVSSKTSIKYKKDFLYFQIGRNLTQLENNLNSNNQTGIDDNIRFLNQFTREYGLSEGFDFLKKKLKNHLY